MNQITEVPEPPLPDLDGIQRDVGEWEDAMLFAARSNPNWYRTAAGLFAQAYTALDSAREILDIIEQEAKEQQP